MTVQTIPLWLIQIVWKGQTNLITWHTLLQKLMEQGKRKVAYRMFVDVSFRESLFVEFVTYIII